MSCRILWTMLLWSTGYPLYVQAAPSTSLPCPSIESRKASHSAHNMADACLHHSGRDGAIHSYVSLVDQTAPAVVELYTTSNMNPYGDDPFFAMFFRSFGAQISPQNANGSGVVVDASGLVATCAHVIQNADTIHVRLHDGQYLKARVVLVDTKEDAALLKVEGTHALPHLCIGRAEDLQVGDALLAIGNAFGLGISVTHGIVSTNLRSINERIVLQTDAAINPGNSGGALINTQGQLVAMPNAILSRSGGSHGVAFGLPAAIISALLQEYKNNGRKPWFGLRGQFLSREQLASISHKPIPSGIAITFIHPQSPLRTCGLQLKDIVIAWNGKPISSLAMLQYWQRTSSLSETVQLDILRGTQCIKISCQVESAPKIEPKRYTVPSGLLQGLEVTDLETLSMTEEHNPNIQHGVAVTRLGHNLRDGGWVGGIQVGDVIIMLNGQQTHSLADFQKAATSKRTSRGTQCVIQRGTQHITLQWH